MSNTKYYLIREDYKASTYVEDEEWISSSEETNESDVSENGKREKTVELHAFKILKSHLSTADEVHQRAYSAFQKEKGTNFPATFNVEGDDIVIESEADFFFSHLIVAQITGRQYAELLALFPDCVESFGRSVLLKYFHS